VRRSSALVLSLVRDWSDAASRRTPEALLRWRCDPTADSDTREQEDTDG